MSPSSPAPIARTSLALDRQAVPARLTLVPPKGKPPTLDLGILDEFDQAVASVESDPPALLVIDSASPKTFCAGANLAVLRDTDEKSIVPWVETGHRVLARLEDLPCVTVAHVAGHALGGGLELALACDLIYATDQASFGLTEARLGFVPGWGGTFRLPERVGLAAARRMFFVSDVITADEAARMGLADFSGSAEAVLEKLKALASNVAIQSKVAIAGFKKISNDARRAARAASACAEAEASASCLRDPDTKHRLSAFLSRKK